MAMTYVCQESNSVSGGCVNIFLEKKFRQPNSTFEYNDSKKFKNKHLIFLGWFDWAREDERTVPGSTWSSWQSRSRFSWMEGGHPQTLLDSGTQSGQVR